MQMGQAQRASNYQNTVNDADSVSTAKHNERASSQYMYEETVCTPKQHLYLISFSFVVVSVTKYPLYSPRRLAERLIKFGYV